MRSIRNCNVAVVGGAGFLGSHLVNHLIDDRGCKVLVVDNLVAGRREFVHPEAKFEHHDITGSEDHLRHMFELFQLDYTFLYAAHPYVPTSYDRPLHVCDTNFMGAVKCINAAQEAGAKGVMQVSSAELYGGNSSHTVPEDPEGKIDELFPVSPHSSYAVAKSAVDSYCQVSWRERKTPVIAVRQFNAVGERDLLHPYVIPAVIQQLQPYVDRIKPILMPGGSCSVIPDIKLGNNSTRDFIYAGDAVRMTVELLEKGQLGTVYNLGSEQSIKIYALADLIAQVMGFSDGVNIIPEEARMRKWELWNLRADNAKLYSVIDYRPRVSLKEAIRRTVADYRERGCKWCWEK